MLMNYKSIKNLHKDLITLRKKIISDNDENGNNANNVTFLNYFQDFISNCQNLSEDNLIEDTAFFEVFIGLIFNDLFLQLNESNKLIEELLETMFPQLMFNCFEKYAIHGIENNDIDSLNNALILSKSFFALLYASKMYIRSFSGVDFLFSLLLQTCQKYDNILEEYDDNSENNENCIQIITEIIKYSLESILLLAKEHVLNLFLISKFKIPGEIQGTDVINFLWILFKKNSIINTEISQAIANLVLSIYFTFETNVEEEMIESICVKALYILDDNPKNYTLSFLKLLYSFSNNDMHIKTLFGSGSNITIQRFLMALEAQMSEYIHKFQMILNENLNHMNNLNIIADVFKNRNTQMKSLENLTKLIDSTVNNGYLKDNMNDILNTIYEITEKQVFSLKILENIEKINFFSYLKPKILIPILFHFEFSFNPSLHLATIDLLLAAIPNFQKFTNLFLKSSSNMEFLMNTAIYSSYTIRIKAARLLARIIKISNRPFIEQLLANRAIQSSIQMISDFEDRQLLSEMSLSLCKVIDMGYGTQIIQELLEIQEALVNILETEETNSNESYYIQFLLNKISRIPHNPKEST